jgi:hypothetical protein
MRCRVHRLVLLSLALWPTSSALVAQSWSPPFNLSNDPGNSAMPEIAVDHAETLHVVWVDRSVLPQEIRYAQRPRSGAWSAPVAIATFPGNTQFAEGEPKVAIGPDDTVHVVFADDNSGSSEIGHLSKPVSGTWSSVANVSVSPGMRSEFPDVKVTLDGTVHVTWIESQDFQVCCSESFYANRPPAGAWSVPLNISNTPQNQYPQRMAAGLDGSVHVVWTQQDSFPSLSNLYYVVRSPAGTWSTPLNLTGAVAGRGITDMLVASDLTVHVCYHEAPGEILLLSLPFNGTWGAPVNVSNNGSASWNGSLTEDATGTLHLVWQDDASGNYDLVHSKKLPLGAWSSAVPVAATTGSSDLPRVAATGDGLHVVWQDATPGANDVFHAEAPIPALAFVGTPRAPNPVRWALRNAQGQTGNPVLVLLSCSGTQGIPLPDGRRIPLTFDACTRLSLAAAQLFLGFVDGAGNALTPSFPFPVLPGSLPIWSAAVTLDLTTLQFVSVTGAVLTVTQ